MKTIALVTQKGGTGKTTLAASLAVAAQEAGERVFLIDLDPQGSLTSWAERREAESPPVDKVAPQQLPPALAGLAKAGYTLAGEIPDYALKPHGGLTGTLVYWKRIGAAAGLAAGAPTHPHL